VLTAKFGAILPPGFFSPVSISLVLALVGAGATGQTLHELQVALGWPNHQDWQASLVASWEALRRAEAQDEGPTVSIATRVFTKVPVLPSYAEAVNSLFRAELEPLKSASQVNAYVNEATRGMIQEVVDDSIVAQSEMIAVSALYFKGQWLEAFDKTATTVAPFLPGPTLPQSSCHLMRTGSGREFLYHEDATAQYVVLPYDGAKRATGGTNPSPLVALVALPRVATGSPFESVDVSGALAALRAKQHSGKRPGALWLPRFCVDSAYNDFEKTLQALGVQRAFTTSAEFGNVSQVPLKFDTVIHKVRVEVDEQGTEAAAAAVVCIGFGCVAPTTREEPFQMRCNRPFVFSVVHLDAGNVLFAGTVDNPGTVGAAPCPPLAPAPFKSSPFRSVFAAAPVGAALHDSSQFGVEQRRDQACLFTSATRRDVYRVLCAEPRRPLSGQTLRSPISGIARSSDPPIQWLFDVSQPGKLISRKAADAFPSVAPALVASTLLALEEVGQPTQLGIAFTVAFERTLIEEFVNWWTDEDASALSVAFVTAFGNELTPRLDLVHALRSRRLPAEDIAWLRSLPPQVAFDRRLIDAFQG